MIKSTQLPTFISPYRYNEVDQNNNAIEPHFIFVIKSKSLMNIDLLKFCFKEFNIYDIKAISGREQITEAVNNSFKSENPNFKSGYNKDLHLIFNGFPKVVSKLEIYKDNLKLYKEILLLLNNGTYFDTKEFYSTLRKKFKNLILLMLKRFRNVNDITITKLKEILKNKIECLIKSISTSAEGLPEYSLIY